MAEYKTRRMRLQPELPEFMDGGSILLPTAFRLFLYTTGEAIGQLLLLSVSKDRKIARIAFVTEEKYRRQGLMSEAVSMCFSAFSDLGLNIYYLRAVIPAENKAAISFAEKNGFKRLRDGKFSLWEKEKPPTVWHILCTCLGMCVGGFAGSFFCRNYAGGMLLGMTGGFLCGALLNRLEKVKRKKSDNF